MALHRSWYRCFYGVLLLACMGACQSPMPPQQVGERARAERYAVLVTIDGLMPESYLNPGAHGLSVPTLRSFVAQGAFAEGAVSVFPAVTYPAHTTLVTGVNPLRHGIVSNAVFDPLGENQGGWYWYTEDIRAKTLWQVAEEAGLRTALIHWPVGVGARVTWSTPDYWRAGTADDGKLIRALSTPGLFEAVSRSNAGFAARYAPPMVTDEGVTDVATYLLEHERPGLLIVHISDVDSAQHKHGPWSAGAVAAIENADRQLARMAASVEHAGIRRQTLFVVASDHGFASVHRQVNPGALLREAGLLSLEDGRVSAWKAAVLPNGGTAYVYLHDPHDAATREAVLALFKPRSGHPGSGIGRVLSQEEVRALGGDETALLALEAELGTYFGPGLDAYESTAHYAGHHGYDPQRPEMQASLLMRGGDITPGRLKAARLVDVAPTIARWLGLVLQNVEGRPLGVQSR